MPALQLTPVLCESCSQNSDTVCTLATAMRDRRILPLVAVPSTCVFARARARCPNRLACVLTLYTRQQSHTPEMGEEKRPKPVRRRHVSVSLHFCIFHHSLLRCGACSAWIRCTDLLLLVLHARAHWTSIRSLYALQLARTHLPAEACRNLGRPRQHSKRRSSRESFSSLCRSAHLRVYLCAVLWHESLCAVLLLCKPSVEPPQGREWLPRPLKHAAVRPSGPIAPISALAPTPLCACAHTF